LEALGFERHKAEGLVQMVKQSIDEEVAKKSDLLELKAELKMDIALMKAEIGEMKGAIKVLDSKIDKVANDLTSKIQLSNMDLQKKLGGLIIILWGLGLDWGKGYDLIARIFDKIFS